MGSSGQAQGSEGLPSPKHPGQAWEERPERSRTASNPQGSTWHPRQAHGGGFRADIGQVQGRDGGVQGNAHPQATPQTPSSPQPALQHPGQAWGRSKGGMGGPQHPTAPHTLPTASGGGGGTEGPRAVSHPQSSPWHPGQAQTSRFKMGRQGSAPSPSHPTDPHILPHGTQGRQGEKDSGQVQRRSRVGMELLTECLISKTPFSPPHSTQVKQEGNSRPSPKHTTAPRSSPSHRLPVTRCLTVFPGGARTLGLLHAEAQDVAAVVLPGRNDVPGQRHGHGGAGLGVVAVQQRRAELPPDLLQLQEVLRGGRAQSRPPPAGSPGTPTPGSRT